MKNTTQELLLGLLILVFVVSCQKDTSKHYSEEWLNYEENWGWCYQNGFSYPYDTLSNSSQFLMCNFNGEDIQIVDDRSGFNSSIYYKSEFITYQPDAPLNGNEGALTSVMIFFLEESSFRYIGLLVPFSNDSLNYTIQRVFSNPIVQFSGNFIGSKPSLEAYSYCDKVKEAVNFSTFYSTSTKQSFRIDSFSYFLNGSQWAYHLEFSCDGIEVTNSGWNSKGKIDEYGNVLKSDVLVENLLVNKLKCVIDFELPKD